MQSIDFKRSINISEAGKNCFMRIGDIDGDGRMEFVMVKATESQDKRYFPQQVAAITAFSADGVLLWQVGNPEGEAVVCADLPIQIYDIDKDGKNEIIVAMDGELLVMDGKTGEVKKQIPLPDKYACDCIVIADLEGSGYAQNIILKNKYSHMWALDANLNVLWDFQGNIGHCPVAYDINGDGREEIIAGSCVLDASGELLWKADVPGHVNSIAVECLYEPDEPVIVMCADRVCAVSASGEPLWAIDERAQNIVIGKFRDNISREDILLLDSMSLFDLDGEFLYEKNETIYHPMPVSGFDKSGKLYIAGHKKEDICTTLYDGYMRPCYTLDTFGKMAYCDITGSGLSQILIYNDETIEIYSAEEVDLKEAARPYPRQQPKSLYNVSVHNTLPVSKASGGYVVDDFASQNILKWADTYASLNMHNSFLKVTRSEFVLLLASLLNLKEEFSDNFADVSKESTYYEAVGTFKKLGILESEDNLFLPDIPITVVYANGIIEKLGIPLQFKFDDRYELSKQDMARLIQNLNSAG